MATARDAKYADPFVGPNLAPETPMRAQRKRADEVRETSSTLGGGDPELICPPPLGRNGLRVADTTFIGECERRAKRLSFDRY
jgi:hypothetical protein